MRATANGWGRIPPATLGWIASSGSIFGMDAIDRPTTKHFFSTATSFCTGGNPAANPVPGGYATSAVMSYSSYAQLSSDISGGAITGPFAWLMYDNENWAGTPTGEKQDPPTYMTSFGALAHTHGFKVIHAPARDLSTVTGTLYPKNPGETDDQWYLRVIATPAAASCDILLLQNESYQGTATYASLLARVFAAARAVNPDAMVYSEVSTSNGTAAQMTAAAQSVSADGFYAAMPSAIAAGMQFFQAMAAAGY